VAPSSGWTARRAPSGLKRTRAAAATSACQAGCQVAASSSHSVVSSATARLDPSGDQSAARICPKRLVSTAISGASAAAFPAEMVHSTGVGEGWGVGEASGVGVAAGSGVASGTVAVAAAGDSSVGAVRSGLAVGAAGVLPQAESSRAARTGRIIQR